MTEEQKAIRKNRQLFIKQFIKITQQQAQMISTAKAKYLARQKWEIQKAQAK